MKFALLFCSLMIVGNITAWFVIYKNIQTSIPTIDSNQFNSFQTQSSNKTSVNKVPCETDFMAVHTHNHKLTEQNDNTKTNVKTTEQIISQIYDNAALDSMLVDLLHAEDELLQALSSDPLLQDSLINAFWASSDEKLNDYLISLFNQTDSPELQQLRVDLLQSGDRQQKMYGFKLLREDSLNTDIIHVLNSTLSHARDDKELLLSAIYATPSTPVPGEAAYQLLTPLSELTEHSDPVIRDASLNALSTQAKNIDELRPVLTLLGSDNMEERIGAADALKFNTLATEELKNIVLQNIKNSPEHSELRNTLVSLLDRFSLTKSQRDIYTQLH